MWYLQQKLKRKEAQHGTLDLHTKNACLTWIWFVTLDTHLGFFPFSLIIFEPVTAMLM